MSQKDPNWSIRDYRSPSQLKNHANGTVATSVRTRASFLDYSVHNFVTAALADIGDEFRFNMELMQPEYDLVAVDGERVLKVSVKGSQDGKWGLTQSYIENADYHGAADKWLAKHSKKTVFCLVQIQKHFDR